MSSKASRDAGNKGGFFPHTERWYIESHSDASGAPHGDRTGSIMRSLPVSARPAPAVIAIITLLAVACGGSPDDPGGNPDDPGTTPTPPATDTPTLTRTVI